MTRILGKLKLWQKLLLIVVSFALPIGVLAIFTFDAFHENISLARLELSGVKFKRPLADLFRDIAGHYLLSQRYSRGEKQLEADIVARQAQIDAAFSALDQVRQRFGTVLKFTPGDLAADGKSDLLPEKVRMEWLAVKADWQQLSPERSKAAHERLIATVMAMIARVEDTSELARDPGVASMNLLIANFEAAPNAQLHLTQMGELALRTLAEPAAGRQMALVSKIAILREADLPKLTDVIETAVREDARLPGATKVYNAMCRHGSRNSRGPARRCCRS